MSLISRLLNYFIRIWQLFFLLLLYHIQFYRAVGHCYGDQNRKAAYPADPSDGRALYRGAIREHLVKVTPKQMHLVSSQIDLQLTDKFHSWSWAARGQADHGAAPDMAHGAAARRLSDGSGVRIARIGTSADTEDKLRGPRVKSSGGDCEEGARGVLPSLATHCVARRSVACARVRAP